MDRWAMVVIAGRGETRGAGIGGIAGISLDGAQRFWLRGCRVIGRGSDGGDGAVNLDLDGEVAIRISSVQDDRCAVLLGSFLDDVGDGGASGVDVGGVDGPDAAVHVQSAASVVLELYVGLEGLLLAGSSGCCGGHFVSTSHLVLTCAYGS